MPTTILRNLKSNDEHLRSRSADLNEIQFVTAICLTAPIARYVNTADIPLPPAPAWFIPDTNDIYIHTDAAEIGTPRHVICTSAELNGSKEVHIKAARTLGLLAHEAGHAAISDQMTEVEKAAPHHQDLLVLLEELRVENFALRRVPQVRRFLRASFGIVLANLPDDFTSKSHVVRAWAIARGRTLAGVALPDETEAVDTAARTLLGDDTIDALTDLLQEALTLTLIHHSDQTRMIEICDEWIELVGESAAAATSCTKCVKATKSGKPEPDKEGEGGSGKADSNPEDDEAGDDGDGAGDDNDDESGDPDAGTDAGKPDDDEASSDWGNPGAGEPEADDDGADSPLSDEDAELMKMFERDLKKR